MDYRWTVRGVDVNLIRRLRVLALLRDVPVAVLTNQAIAEFLEREEEPSQPQQPSATPPEQHHG